MSYSLIAKTAAGSSDNVSVTTTAINTTGANFIALWLIGASNLTETPTDSKSNTWTPLTSGSVPGGELGTWYYCENPTTDANHTFSCTAIGHFASIGAMAFSGGTTSSFDQETGSDTFGTTLQPGSQTPSNNNELVLQGLCFNTAQTSSPTIDESYTHDGDGTDYINKDSNHQGLAMAYKIQTTATATNPTWTEDTTTSMVARSASFKSSSGAATGQIFLPGIFLAVKA